MTMVRLLYMLQSGDIPTIYGIDLQARSLTAVFGSDPDKSQFLVGTQSLRVDNQIHLVNYDTYKRQLSKYIFGHPQGEIWGLAAASYNERIFASVYASFNDAKTERKLKVGLWRLPEELEDQTDAMEDNSQILPLESVCAMPTEAYGNAVSILTHPDKESDWMLLTENQLVLLSGSHDGGYRETSCIRLDEGTRASQRIFSVARWSPHDQHQEVATVCQRSVIGWDMRSGKSSFHLDQAHSQLVRDIDYNPYKQYQLASCGDDGAVCLWDVRSLHTSLSGHYCSSAKPLISLTSGHSHWVWSVRYNPSQDMLLLSCSSDTRVALYTVPSFCSNRQDDEEEEEEEDDEAGGGGESDTASSGREEGKGDGDDDKENRTTTAAYDMPGGASSTTEKHDAVNNDTDSLDKMTSTKLVDGVIKVFENHEDSVYAAEWSQVDSWILASLSYDGRLVINYVPIVEKLKIMRSK